MAMEEWEMIMVMATTKQANFFHFSQTEEGLHTLGALFCLCNPLQTKRLLGPG